MTHQRFNFYFCLLTMLLTPLYVHAQLGADGSCILDETGICISPENTETPLAITAVNPRFTVSWLDENNDHHDDDLRIEFDVTDGPTPTGGYAIIGSMNREPIFPNDIVVHDGDPWVQDLRFSMPDSEGVLNAKVCGVHLATNEPMGCSEAIQIEIVSRLGILVAIHGSDPADESGHISAHFRRSWHDENEDGHDDTLSIDWTVEGDLGASNGFVVLGGMNADLVFPRDQLGENLWWHGSRNVHLDMPENAGEFYARICSFDHFRFVVSQCSETIQIKVVEGAQAIVPMLESDPADETGDLNVDIDRSWQDHNDDRHDDSIRVRWEHDGNLGEASGFIVLAGFDFDLVYPRDLAWQHAWPEFRSADLTIPETSGFYHIQVCAFDGYRDQVTSCSPTTNIELVQGADAVVAIFGEDPADEEGQLTLTLGRSWQDHNGDGHDDKTDARWTRTGNVGQEGGFVLVAAVDMDPIYPRDFVRFTWSGEDFARIEIPNIPGTLRARVCAYDPYRDLATHCSDPSEVKLVQGPQAVIPIYGTDPRDETGDIVSSLGRSWQDHNGDDHDDLLRISWSIQGAVQDVNCDPTMNLCDGADPTAGPAGGVVGSDGASHTETNRGEAGGFFIMAAVDADPVYPNDVVWQNQWWTNARSMKINIPQTTGEYRVQVCAYDPYREEMTTCGGVTSIQLVQGREAVVAIHGMDPRDEIGNLDARIDRAWGDEDGDGHSDYVNFQWDRTGNVGVVDGFRIYAAVDADPTPVEENFVGRRWSGALSHKFPVPQIEGQLRVRVCSFDKYRYEVVTCSNVATIEGVHNRRGRIVLMHGPDPRNEMGYIDPEFHKDWWYTRNTGRYDRFKVTWEVGGDLGESGGFVILGALNTEPSYPQDLIVHRHAGHGWNGMKLYAPDSTGDFLVKICALDVYRDEIIACSDTRLIPIIDGLNGITALFGGDPRDEEGELTAHLTRTWQDHNGDGFDDSIGFRWAVTGNIGETSGFTILMGDNAQLSYPEDLAWRHRWNGYRSMRLTPPQREGDLYTQVCAFDEYRGEVTQCSDPMMVRLIERDQVIIPVSPTDPMDETGSIVATRDGSRVEWQTQGNLGVSSGLMIMMSPNARLDSPSERIQIRINNNTDGRRNLREHLRSRAANWSVAVCNYDRYRDTTHECSNTINFTSVMQGDQVHLIEGIDPLTETGSVHASADGHLVTWTTTGTVGQGSGFRVLYTQESIPTMINSQMIGASTDDRQLIIDVVNETATYQIRVCSYDEYRDTLGICSNVLTQDLTETEETEEVCIPLNESLTENYDVISGETLAVNSPIIYPELDGPHTEEEAARFLQRATFGVTRAAIDRLLALGYNGWIQEQFSAAPSQFLAWINRREDACQHVDARTITDTFYHNAVEGEDQLRQRMSFALSQIFVVSHANLAVRSPVALGTYYDDMQTRSFDSFRSIMESVTLSPAMGTYLGMLNNRAPRPNEEFSPDENYARELMQLFSIGLYRLNLDGTPILDRFGHKIPSYDQTAVKGLARALTGWTINGENYNEGWGMPMVPVDEIPGHEPFRDHDTDEKALFVDSMTGERLILSSGQNAREDLADVMTSLTYHENTAPFISKQLIQRFVTSNPTPAYVERVASIFIDNGRGERGDMGAVIQAILLDPEALNGHEEHPDTFGKVKEPTIRETSIIRALGGYADGDRQRSWRLHGVQGQAPLGAPSVFNFYRPDYSLASSGASDEDHLDDELTTVAPELQIVTDTWIVTSLNRLTNHVADWSIGTAPAIANLGDLAQDPADLVHHLNLVLFGGSMSSEMQTIVVDYATNIPIVNGPNQRISGVLTLLASSPQFSVQH